MHAVFRRAVYSERQKKRTCTISLRQMRKPLRTYLLVHRQADLPGNFTYTDNNG